MWLIYPRHCTVHTNFYQNQPTFADVKHKSVFGVLYTLLYYPWKLVYFGLHHAVGGTEMEIDGKWFNLHRNQLLVISKYLL